MDILVEVLEDRLKEKLKFWRSHQKYGGTKDNPVKPEAIYYIDAYQDCLLEIQMAKEGYKKGV